MGKIVAAGKELKNAKQLSAAIPLLPSVKEAIDYLNQAKPPIEEISPQLDALIREKDARIQALENQVSLSSPTELRKLRAENETLKLSAQDLEERLKRLLTERRIPPDADSMLEHITILERNVTNLTAQIEASGNAKK
jgi:predicted  nucleic acid-binding Zn-ribbon protein